MVSGMIVRNRQSNTSRSATMSFVHIWVCECLYVWVFRVCFLPDRSWTTIATHIHTQAQIHVHTQCAWLSLNEYILVSMSFNWHLEVLCFCEHRICFCWLQWVLLVVDEWWYRVACRVNSTSSTWHFLRWDHFSYIFEIDLVWYMELNFATLKLKTNFHIAIEETLSVNIYSP